MNIDFDTIVCDQEGNPVKDTIAAQSNGGTAKDLTLGNAAIYALNTSFQDEQSLTGNDKFNRGRLAYDIYKTPQLDLKSEDITLIKNVIGKMYTPMIVYQTYNLLDNSK